MSDSKVFMFPEQQGGSMDAATLALLQNGGMNNWMNNPFMYLIWIYMMRWFGNDGNNNGLEASTQRQIQTLSDQMNDNHTSDLIMAAIQGNNTAIGEVATRLGCDLNAIASAVQGVRSDIGMVGSQLGFSSERVINAVNQGDAGLMQLIKEMLV